MKKKNKIILITVVAGILIIGAGITLQMFPIVPDIRFDTASDAFNYVYKGKVVEGIAEQKEVALVTYNNGNNTGGDIFIIKDDKGWIPPIRGLTRNQVVNDYDLVIQHYKINNRDIVIVSKSIDNKSVKIKDNMDSEFTNLNVNGIFNIAFWFTSIDNITSDYKVTVNGKTYDLNNL